MESWVFLHLLISFTCFHLSGSKVVTWGIFYFACFVVVCGMPCMCCCIDFKLGPNSFFLEDEKGLSVGVVHMWHML
jgi:hypothetical protein